MDGLEVLNKISRKADEPKNLEKIKEYGEWWNNLGSIHENFNKTFINIETDSIVKKYFHRTSSHQPPRFLFDIQNDISPPGQYSFIFGRYSTYNKFPSVVFTRINKNIISYPSLHRVKKHLKICTCPILEFTDHNINLELEINDIEIYDETVTELHSINYQEEKLKTNIFRLKVLLGLAVFYMIVKI